MRPPNRRARWPATRASAPCSRVPVSGPEQRAIRSALRCRRRDRPAVTVRASRLKPVWQASAWRRAASEVRHIKCATCPFRQTQAQRCMGRASTAPRWAGWCLASRLSAGLHGSAQASMEPRCDPGFKRPDGRVARGMTEACKKILCIDDDRAVAEMIAEDLAARGFEVTMAHDGQEGLVAILKTMPDLVLCDVNMPVMSGFELLERLN